MAGRVGAMAGRIRQCFDPVQKRYDCRNADFKRGYLVRGALTATGALVAVIAFWGVALAKVIEPAPTQVVKHRHPIAGMVVLSPTPSLGVRITSPLNNATVSGTVAVMLEIDSSRVNHANVFVDGIYLASTPPLSLAWNTTKAANGPHEIDAEAFDSGGSLVGFDSIIVNANNLKPTPTATRKPTPTATRRPTPTHTRSRTPTRTPTASPTSKPTPSIGLLNPSSAIAGGGGLTLTVFGKNFVPSSTVRWNGGSRPTTFVTNTRLHASITASDIAMVGSAFVTVANPASAGGVSAASTFFTGSSGGPGFAEVVLNEQANDLVFNPANHVIYLSVPNTGGPKGNSISVLSLAKAEITSSPFAGSNPDVLAISDDSRFLYAGIDGLASVRRFLLPNLNTDITYSLGADSFFGPYFALDLQVAPGAPHTTAVTLANTGVSPSAQGGIVIFDDASPRPMRAPGFGGTGNLFDSLQWGSNATALFAANNEDTGFDFYTLSVSSTGVVLDHDYGSRFSSFNNRIHFDAHTKLIYADDGHVVNPSNGSPAGSFPASGPMVPDGTINRAFFVSQGATTVINSFNLFQMTSITSITIPNVTGNPLRLIRWGQNGLAFNTDSGQVYLIGGNFVH